MEFENIRFDQSYLLKMWKECKSDVFEESEKSDIREDDHRVYDDDLNQELRFLEDKIKNLKYREEGLHISCPCRPPPSALHHGG